MKCNANLDVKTNTGLLKMKKYIVIAVVLAIIAIVFWSRKANNTEPQARIETKAQRGSFDVVITTTGDLEAENSVKIDGPSNLRKIRIYNVKITDLIPEGSMVDSGDYVGMLDRSEISTRLSDIETNLELLQTELSDMQIDTAMEMQNLRDQLLNLKFAVEEQEIVVQQSVYEPKATIRKAKMELEKAKRALEQGQINFKLKREQAKMRILQQKAKIDEQQRNHDQISAVMDDFVIKAPASGMVIYENEWGGGKRKVGSTITPWDRTVATLPDFSTMISKTYINEIDFNKISKGMEVVIGVDAFPEKKYTGKIKKIANIGEQLEGSDAKVFEVIVKINEIDSIMRPSMTTSNSIRTITFKDVVYIPLEALHQTDSTTFVYRNGGKVEKQEVKHGAANDNYVIIEKGLEAGDDVLLNIPAGEQ